MSNKVLVPQKFDEYSKTQKNELGVVVWSADGTKAYKYVKVTNDLESDVTVAGQCADYANVAGTEVQNKGTSATAIPAGVFLAAVPESTATITYYCWIQVAGVHAAVLTDGTVAAGDPVTIGDGTDGTVDPRATLEPELGVALAIDAGSPTTSPVLIKCL